MVHGLHVPLFIPDFDFDILRFRGPWTLFSFQIVDILDPLTEHQKNYVTASKKKKEKMKDQGLVELVA